MKLSKWHWYVAANLVRRTPSFWPRGESARQHFCTPGLNMNTENPVSALRMETGDCYITEVTPLVSASAKNVPWNTIKSILNALHFLSLSLNGGFLLVKRWETSTAAVMLRRPEPIKERIELTTLSIIAIQITHSTTFTLLLLLRIQRYMLRNHIATWAYDNNSGRNLDLNLFIGTNLFNGKDIGRKTKPTVSRKTSL